MATSAILTKPQVEHAATVPCAPLTVELVVTHSGFAAMADEWNRLAGEIPFRRWEWLETWWRHFRNEGDRLCLLAVRDDNGDLCGVAPWYITRTTLGGREIRFLGSGSACSEYLTLLCLPGREGEIAARIANWLMREGAVAWDTLALNAVDPRDQAIRCLMAAMGREGHTVRNWRSATTWQVDLPDSWDEYLATLSSKRRAHIRRICRQRLDSGQARWRQAQTEEALDERLALLGRLSRRRTRKGGERSSLECPRFTGFMHEVAQRFFKLGKVDLSWIELDGETVAVSFAFIDGDTYFGYQMAMDQERMEVEPGWILLISVIRNAQRVGLRRFDFLRGSESYKTDWRAAATPLVEVRVAGRSPAARLRDRAWAARENARALAKHALRRCGLRSDETITRPRRVLFEI